MSGEGKSKTKSTHRNHLSKKRGGVASNEWGNGIFLKKTYPHQNGGEGSRLKSRGKGGMGEKQGKMATRCQTQGGGQLRGEHR